MRTQYQNTENVYKNTVIIERIKLIKEHITDKMKENRSRRIIKVAQQIKSNVDNGRKYGKLNKKFRGKITHLILSKMKKTTELKVHHRF